MSTPTLAVVGCGAIAEAFYIPGIQERPELLRKLVLIDRDARRVEELRASIGAAAAVTDLADFTGDIDGAIVATPHHLHTPLTLDFVGRGVHVVSEKPLSATVEEVDQVIEAAAASKVTVTVNHTRRLFNSFQQVQREATGGALGEIREVDIALGGPFGWPAATNTYFGKAAGGRGVLYDLGPHVLDVVCWFLGDVPELVSYTDDSAGGTEAVAKVELRRGDTTVRVHLSWISELRNTYRVVGSKATLEGRFHNGSTYTKTVGNRTSTVKADKVRDFTHYGKKLIDNFVDVIAGKAEPFASARDIRPSVALINDCYANRTQLPAPWNDALERLTHA